MSLAQKDLLRIRSVVRTEVDNLARVVARGFESVDKRFEQVDKRFTQIDKRFEQMDKRFEQVDKRLDLVDKRLDRIDEHLVRIDARLDALENDVAEIRKHFVYRDEFEDVLARVRLIEKKLGIKA